MKEPIKFLVPTNQLLGVMKVCPRKDPRRILKGVMFKLDNKQCTLAASNGKSLIETSFNVESEDGGGYNPISFVVPIEALDMVVKSCKDAPELSFEVLLDDDGGIKIIRIKDLMSIFEFSCSPVFGKYPSYQQVFPKKNGDEIKISFDIELLKGVLEGCNHIEGVSVRNKNVVVELSPSNPSNTWVVHGAYRKKEDEYKAIFSPIKLVSDDAND